METFPTATSRKITVTIINSNIPYPYSKVGEYEDKFNLKQKHDDMLQLLLLFDTFCKRYGIFYSLADGTLLGAMRHGDFIPWDDDVDVMVTRSEYNKIRAAVQQDTSIRLFKAHFLDRVTAPGYVGRKIYMDLFINEDMPANRLVFAQKKFTTRLLRTHFNNTTVQNVRHDSYSGLHKALRSILMSVLRTLVDAITRRYDTFELNDRLVHIGNHRSSGIYTRYTSRMYETKRRFDKTSYEEGYAYVNFRGEQLMVIKNADRFLREMYGDYLTLLPEEKRKPEHPVNMMDSPASCLKWYN